MFYISHHHEAIPTVQYCRFPCTLASFSLIYGGSSSHTWFSSEEGVTSQDQQTLHVHRTVCLEQPWSIDRAALYWRQSIKIPCNRWESWLIVPKGLSILRDFVSKYFGRSHCKKYKKVFAKVRIVSPCTYLYSEIKHHK